MTKSIFVYRLKQKGHTVHDYDDIYTYYATCITTLIVVIIYIYIYIYIYILINNLIII